MLEQIYTDFTTKLLPKIQEGLVITKDYFLDLFGRYVKYLIVTDTITAGVGMFLLIMSIVIFIKAYRNWDSWKPENSYDPVSLKQFFSIVIIILFGSLGIGFLVSGISHLVKDIYIPEIRVIEQIKSMGKE